MVRFDENRPLDPLRPPARRHYLRLISTRGRIRPRNTIILPGVNVAADVRAINAGEATRGTYMAIGIYNQYGLTPEAEDRLVYSDTTDESRREARRILRLGGLIS